MTDDLGHAVAEEIASRDRNNLFRASALLSDRDRYRAFCAYYSVMRVVDDRIDELPSRLGLPESRRREEHAVVSAWERAVSCCYAGDDIPKSVAAACGLQEADLLFGAFTEALDAIRPPLDLWSRFFDAMHWDLDHERFRTWTEFLEYAEGASVAPTTIYLYLLTSQRSRPGGSVPVGFDIAECGRRLGRFAYLGHIVRDVAEDLRLGERGLIYLPLEDMRAFGVSEELLFSDLDRGRASEPTRLLVAELVHRAWTELAGGRSMLSRLDVELDANCEIVLELIISVYERVLDKIRECSFDTMGSRHLLTASEKESVLREIMMTKRRGSDGIVDSQT